jgi:hypothetical protein
LSSIFPIWILSISTFAKYSIIGIGEIMFIRQFKRDIFNNLKLSTLEVLIFHLVIKNIFFFFIPSIYIPLRLLLYTLTMSFNEVRETMHIMNSSVFATIFSIGLNAVVLSIVLIILATLNLLEVKLRIFEYEILFVWPVSYSVSTSLFKYCGEWYYRREMNKNKCCNNCHRVQTFEDLPAFELFNLSQVNK